MATFTQVMDGIAAGLAAALPGRVVTRERRKFKQYTTEEITAGLWVVNAKGKTRDSDGRSGARLVQAVGLVRLANPASDEQVEETEFALMAELETWADSHNSTAQDCAGAGFLVNIIEFTQSPAEAKPSNTAVVFAELEVPGV